MKSFLHSQAVQKLLQRLDAARGAVGEAEPGSDEHEEAVRFVEVLYAELGMELYGFARVGVAEEEDVDDADTMERRLTTLNSEEEEEDEFDPPTQSRADDEITVQRRLDSLASAGFLEDDSHTIPRVLVDGGLDSNTESGATHDERTATGGNTDGHVEHVRGDEHSHTPVQPTARAVKASSGWAADLRALLDTMPLPERWDDAVEVATEAALVQWATSDLSERWANYPPSVRISLIGLLASRARFLEARLSVPAGPRVALERLRDFRRLHKLSSVVALLEDRGPEHKTWDADARHWWGVLVEGLAA